MDRGRLLPVATALLAIVVVAVVAPVLETTPIASPYEAPAAGDADGSGSLVSVLFVLVVAILELLGIEGEPGGLPGESPMAALLEAVIPLLPSLAVLLVAGLVLASLGVAARRLPVAGALPPALVARLRPAGGDGVESPDEEWPPGESDSGVAEAWLAVTAATDPDRPAALTPAEWAEAAVESGLDDDAVADLTRLFRETRYGGAEETPERRRRAGRDADRLGGDSE